MTTSSSYASAWKLCALICLAMILLSLIPQIHLWIVRGRDWNGAYVGPYGDELLYAAYVNALIEGRTRKNDPYGAKDDSASAPLPESFFSIQFVPAYAIALPTRMFGSSVATAFIVLIVVTALLAGLSVFWLLNCVTGDHRVAAAGTVFVLCLGCAVGRYGLFGTFVDIGFPALPFLRRYQPAMAFPLFFVFQLLVWRALTSESRRRAWVSAFVAGLTLATLVFSYLYLWTAAAAWLACIGSLWFYFRPSDRRKTLVLLALIGVIAVIALVPYAYLVTQQAAIQDEHLIIISSHRPDLFRVHEILGAIILLFLVVGTFRQRIKLIEPRAIYTASLALLPFVVFNQQVLTGKTLQAFHFEMFVVNYSTLVSLTILLTLFWKPVPRRFLSWIAVASFVWGIAVVGLPSRLLFVPWAVSNDQMIPVLRRLKELSKQDGTLADLRTKGQASTLVFSPSVPLIAQLPSWTSQGTLLDVTGTYCSGQTREQQKELLHMHLYYANVHSESLRDALSNTPGKSADALFNIRPVIFGHQRVFRYLSPQFEPIQDTEVEREVEAYVLFVNSFSREEVLKRVLTYAIVPADTDFDSANLDRWYERDMGERVGAYTLYRLRLRN
jgi:hypothetical protein